jgi:hypothetical protein
MTAWMDKPDGAGMWFMDTGANRITAETLTHQGGVLVTIDEADVRELSGAGCKWRRIPSPAELDALERCRHALLELLDAVDEHTPAGDEIVEEGINMTEWFQSHAERMYMAKREARAALDAARGGETKGGGQ